MGQYLFYSKVMRFKTRALKGSVPKSGAPGASSIFKERKVERAHLKFEERKLECAPIFWEHAHCSGTPFSNLYH